MTQGLSLKESLRHSGPGFEVSMDHYAKLKCIMFIFCKGTPLPIS